MFSVCLLMVHQVQGGVRMSDRIVHNDDTLRLLFTVLILQFRFR